jgi:GNAT superfamily N-acetyltransferase
MLRQLTTTDIPDLLNATQSAGWNQTEQDWLRLLRLAPHGCFGVEHDNRIVSSATVFPHEPDLAWLGMVITHPDYRGRGFSRLVVTHALETTAHRTVRLDATDQGRPLYRSLGFLDEYPIERWERPAQPPVQKLDLPPCPSFKSALDSIYRIDQDRNDPDKSDPDNSAQFENVPYNEALYNGLAQIGSASLPDGSFAMSRPGSRAAYFGPCIARDTAATRDLLRWCLARHPNQPVYWDLFPDNARAVEIAREHGFLPRRRLMRMTLRAAPDSAPNPNYYAIAGFEYG